MPQRQPQRLPLSSIKEMLDSDFNVPGVTPFISTDFAIVVGANTGEAIHEIFEQSTPYRVDDIRIIAFTKGDVDVTANLLKYHITDNTVGVMGTGGIIQMDRVARDVKVTGLVLKEGFLKVAMNGRLPAVFGGGGHSVYVQVAAHECEMVVRMIGLLRLLVNGPDYSREAAASLVATIVNYVANLYERYDRERPAPQSRQQDIFNRFIAMVNEHCRQHHALAFYADRLCITQRYLGTLVKQASGITAKEWIDKAIINEAKVALKHSDLTVAQIADELNFPNPSFFTKFFRRMTGMAPSQYQSL